MTPARHSYQRTLDSSASAGSSVAATGGGCSGCAAPTGPDATLSAAEEAQRHRLWRRALQLLRGAAATGARGAAHEADDARMRRAAPERGAAAGSSVGASIVAEGETEEMARCELDPFNPFANEGVARGCAVIIGASAPRAGRACTPRSLHTRKMLAARSAIAARPVVGTRVRRASATR